MNTGFETLDYVVFIGYAILILGVGLWMSRDKKGHQKNAEDYFLASKSLPLGSKNTAALPTSGSKPKIVREFKVIPPKSR